ncbi:MAG: hypothetical protein C0175_06245, partial [Caldisericum exile]
ELEKKMKEQDAQVKLKAKENEMSKMIEALTVVIENTHEVDEKETYREQADFLFEQIQKIKQIIDRWVVR